MSSNKDNIQYKKMSDPAPREVKKVERNNNDTIKIKKTSVSLKTYKKTLRWLGITGIIIGFIIISYLVFITIKLFVGG